MLKRNHQQNLVIINILSLSSSALYDLIEAIGDEAEPGEKGLIVWVVLEM